jgi:hypothetical protein
MSLMSVSAHISRFTAGLPATIDKKDGTGKKE